MKGSSLWPSLEPARSFFASKDLRSRLYRLRYFLPFALFATVLAYQIFSSNVLDQFSRSLHLVFDLIAYGIIGPVASWFTLSWIITKVEESDRARVDKAQAEKEQQRAIEAVHEQERLLAAICSNSADAIVSFDLQGIIRTWNRGAEMIFGYSAEEMIGKNFLVIVPPELETRGELEWLAEEMRAHNYVRNYQTERIRKDGRRVIVDLTRTTLQNERGEIIGTSAIARDITERVRVEKAIQQLNLELETKVADRTRQLASATEELRRQNAELEKANVELQKLDDLKSEFVSMVSHELRAPLTNINGSLELLLQNEVPGEEQNRREMLQIVQDQTARLTRLVQGILNVSRIEAGQLVLQPQAFDIVGQIEKVIDVWQARGVANRLERPRTMNVPSVWADRDRTEEILFNLIDNAIKYSPEGAAIRLDVESDANYVFVSVSDRGIGIPHDELDKIFEKFHRVDRSDAAENYGNGLGLYICRRLIEAQAGQIWVESVFGEGSTFRFSLPMAGRSEVEPAGSARRSNENARGGRR
jgi:PAS domain S-box-containing protein